MRRARIGDAEIIGRWQCQAEAAEAALTEARALNRDYSVAALETNDAIALIEDHLNIQGSGSHLERLRAVLAALPRPDGA